MVLSFHVDGWLDVVPKGCQAWVTVMLKLLQGIFSLWALCEIAAHDGHDKTGTCVASVDAIHPLNPACSNNWVSCFIDISLAGCVTYFS